jgi:3-methyladenine DNA glycosylase AlkD
MNWMSVEDELKALAQADKAAFFPRFFKTGPGQYGEGDLFLGVIVPDQRKVARRFRDLPLNEVAKLLARPYHECRLTGLLILVEAYRRSRTLSERKAIGTFYLEQLDRVNNWDLVDTSAPKILGLYLWELQDFSTLYELASSGHLWRERVAVLATFPHISKGRFEDALALCEHFLGHSHDLIHKATGWALREVGKKSPDTLRDFLENYRQRMPRTMLRYAIEHFEIEERRRWMR